MKYKGLTVNIKGSRGGKGFSVPLQKFPSTSTGMHAVWSGTYLRKVNPAGGIYIDEKGQWVSVGFTATGVNMGTTQIETGLDWFDSATDDPPAKAPSKHRAKLLEKIPEWMRMSPFKRIKNQRGLDDYNRSQKHFTKGDDGIYRDQNGNKYTQSLETVEIEDALIVTSKTEGGHYVMLDIDFPVAVIPSSSPGKNHVYIDHVIPDEHMDELLKVLVKVGLVNEGIYDLQWQGNKEVSLRLPHVKKGVDLSFDELDEAEQWAALEDKPLPARTNAWGMTVPPRDYYAVPDKEDLTPESPW